MNIYSKQTFLSEFEPKNLGKHWQKNDWMFAEYYESAKDRADERPYRAFLFRSKDRKIFGLKEFYEDRQTDFRLLAARVVTDENFRRTLIADDEDLPKIWKRH